MLIKKKDRLWYFATPGLALHRKHFINCCVNTCLCQTQRGWANSCISIFMWQVFSWIIVWIWNCGNIGDWLLKEYKIYVLRQIFWISHLWKLRPNSSCILFQDSYWIITHRYLVNNLKLNRSISFKLSYIFKRKLTCFDSCKPPYLVRVIGWNYRHHRHALLLIDGC